jgi:hypothetical protein
MDSGFLKVLVLQLVFAQRHDISERPLIECMHMDHSTSEFADLKGFAPERSFSDNSYPQFGWTVFIMSQ